jgi:hypothetical protein
VKHLFSTVVAVALLLLGCGGAGNGSGVSADSMQEGTSAGNSTASPTSGSGEGDGGVGVAGGVGSGGTGVSGEGGVGSGGTGATASVGIGSVDGFGSIIVNGTHHNIENATISLPDANQLKLGMTVWVGGTVSADRSVGTASSVFSAVEFRGTVSGLDVAAGTFDVLSTTVSVEAATVFDGVAGLGSLADGDTVQIYGLPGVSGELQATRIEKISAGAAAVVTGAVKNLNKGQHTFEIGGLLVTYASSAFDGSLPESGLAEGQYVRLRSASPVATASVLAATSVRPWYAMPTANGTKVSVSGLVTAFASQGSFRVQGVLVDGSRTNVSGGPSRALVNGVRVEVDGVMSGGVLVASKLKIRRKS